MSLSEDFTFSQSSLQDYVDCPRRFELRYIDRLRYPSLEAEPALAHEAHMRQGVQFHKMVQQHLVGVPVDRLAQSVRDDEILSTWWATFTASGVNDLPQQRYAETTLETYIGDYRLIAKYDVLAVDPGGEAIIIDWKTSRNVPRKSWLAKRLQTTVYRYVLARAGAHLNNGVLIPPERIRMRYWYVANGGQQVTFDYSSEQMQADEVELRRLMDDINAANLFPLTSDQRQCNFCTYRSLCNRGESAGQWDEFEADADLPLDADFDVDFDQIAEIEF